MHDIVIDAFNFVLIATSASVRASQDRDNPELAFSILMNMIQSLERRFSDARFFAVWDSHGGTQFRRDIDPNYKANRTTRIADFDAVKTAQPAFDLYGMKSISLEATEADDTIYVLCKELKERGDSITIVSRDRDLLQTVQCGYADEQYDPVSKVMIPVPDYSVVDFKALVGDSSDNLSGVKGIGKVTAMKILNGERQLTSEQRKTFEMYKDIIDASRHPRLDENIASIKNILTN